MAASITPGEFAREVFEYDVQIMRHLVFWEDESVDESSLPAVAHEIAAEIVNGKIFHASAATTVIELYRLDESKKTTVQLLEGEE